MFAPARRADRVLTLVLVLADVITIPAVFFLTYWLRTIVFSSFLPQFHHEVSTYLEILPVVAVMWVISFASSGLYIPERHPIGMGEISKLMKALVYLTVSLMAASYLVKMDYSRIMLFMFVAVSLPVSMVIRAAARRLSQVIAPVTEVPRILVVGTGDVALRVIEILQKLPTPPPEIAGIVSEENASLPNAVGGVPVVGSLPDMRRLILSMQIDEVFFAAPRIERSRMLDLISSVTERRVHFRLVTDLFEIATNRTDLDNLLRLPIVEIGYGRQGMINRFSKRLTDLLVSGILIALLSPMMLFIYFMLLLQRKGSPIFSQSRIGRSGKPFTLFKFRTMKPEAGEYEVAPLSSSDPRVTGIGRFLRKTSLDELPQLLNVLFGTMSLVGPRPEMDFIVREYNQWQRHRLDVKPGLTGLWQIMGRKDLPLHENIEFDFYYIRNQSLMLDFSIMFRTLSTLFRGKGAY
jgi:exopolysaccharide biosynthesis polyprenyl glycosylphosphotransferase